MVEETLTHVLDANWGELTKPGLMQVVIGEDDRGLELDLGANF